MLLSYLALLPGVLASCQAAPVATTLNGTYTGRYLAEFAQDLFLGIPFAQAGRLENPTPLNETWEGTRSAEWYGNICPVPASERSVRNANVTGKSDDCLNLNIIRPSRASLKNKDEKLPVAVWLYGGAFADGFGADLNSNYSWVVQASVAKDMPIMAVTLNYRVGFFGFPGGEEIAAAGLTNLGLKDQRQALRWVRENIAAFGGDPDKITVWGQSAGGNSIMYQMLAYDGQAHDNLFRAAIMSSGSIGIGNTIRPDREDAIQGYRRILNETGCLNATDTITCLREAPLDLVYNAAASTPTQPTWWPTIDGDFLTQPPSLQLAAGHFPRNITLLLGTNDDEGFALSNLLGAGTETEPQLLTLLRTIFPHAHPTTLTTLLSLYPATAPAPPYALPLTSTPQFCTAVLAATPLPCGAQYRRLSAILGDYGLIHGRRDVAAAWAAAGQTAYTWRFSTWPTSFPIDPALESQPGFAGHGAEYAYFFRFPRGYELWGNNPHVAEGGAHRRLMEVVSTRVIAFVYSGGDPNLVEDPDVPAWPKYTVENPSNLVLNATAIPDKLNVHVEPDTWRQEGMALWAKYPLELDLFVG
ncbi:Alpha/Beta hydrolase protein [Chaetomium tenue]|uniref:Alpha/Beta hydrolase protein n=1 Tax=Chaetomium tenue TaxID=1854479 RepID=A0ACB7NYC7_9PEZI|nr:Alpha/Beta hydrolase protein [Chaetomium globosum]